MTNANDALQAKLKNLSPEQQAQLLKKLQQKRAATSSAASNSISKVARTQNHYPLSHAQQRVWFLEQYSEHSNAHNIAASFELNGPLDIQVLKQSFNIIVQRHESLRTVFTTEGNNVVQQVLDHMPCELLEIEQQTLEQEGTSTHSKLLSLAARIFDLEQGPLFQLTLIKCGDKCGEQKNILSIVMHHIITDGWSSQIILHELAQIYSQLINNENITLATPDLHYIDYSLWQEQQLKNTNDSQLAFWQQELAGVSNLQLYPDKKANNETNTNKTVAINLTNDTVKALKKRCLDLQCSSFHGLLACYQILLNHYSQQSDFCVGIPVAGRHHSNTESIVGLFVNSLAIRSDIKEQQSTSELIQAIKNRCLQALSKQDVPFEKIVDALVQERNPNAHPIFQAFFSYDQGREQQQLNLKNIQSRFIPTNNQQTKFTLSLTLKDSATGIDCLFEYDNNLFSEQTIQNMAEYFAQIVRVVADSSKDSNVHDLNMDYSRVRLSQSVGTTLDLPNVSHLHQLIEQQALQTPTAIACSDSEQSLSYEALNHAANHLAKQLLESENSRGEDSDIIGVFMPRSCDMLVALLGILKAGKAYLPLSDELPEKRLAYIIEHAQLKQVVVNQAHASNSLFDKLNTVVANINTEATANIKLDTDCESLSKPLFNLIYTSGSTGTPKGVMVTQAGIINRLCWMQEQYPLSAENKVLQKTPFTFDISVWELFWPLMTGASVHFLNPDEHKEPEKIRQCIIEQGISTCHFVPSMLDVFLNIDQLNECTSLQHIFCSGEALLQNQVDKLQQALPKVQLHNLYGPTEAAIDVSFYDCAQKNHASTVPIGKAISNTRLYILGTNDKVVPQGAVGQLHIAGNNLAQGYWQDEEKTKAQFIEHSLEKNSKLYRTGDLARLLPDGNIEYLGRIDHQVKLRGLRIELGDIDNALNQHPDINAAATQLQKINQQDHLVAFYCSNNELDDTQIKQLLAQSLPAYMIPSVFKKIDNLPLSINGKLDRKALPMIATPVAKQEYVAPSNDIEQTLVNIWQELLQVEQVGIRDSFFELGGHSLLATSLLLQIKSHFAIDLPLRSLFEVTDIAGLSQLIQALMPNEADSTNVDDEEFDEGVL